MRKEGKEENGEIVNILFSFRHECGNEPIGKRQVEEEEEEEKEEEKQEEEEEEEDEENREVWNAKGQTRVRIF